MVKDHTGNNKLQSFFGRWRGGGEEVVEGRVFNSMVIVNIYVTGVLIMYIKILLIKIKLETTWFEISTLRFLP